MCGGEFPNKEQPSQSSLPASWMPSNMETIYQPPVCLSSKKGPPMVTDYIKITTQSIQVNISSISLKTTVNLWKNPAKSPDLNPIELVCGSTKTFLRDKWKPKNLWELKDGIRTSGRCWWRLCKVQWPLNKSLSAVVREEGGPSGYWTAFVTYYLHVCALCTIAKLYKV